MPFSNDPLQPLYDQDRRMLGVFLHVSLWEKVQSKIAPFLNQALEELNPTPPAPPVEPLADWDMLNQYWDFSYPLTPDVTCSNCGAMTNNWQEDSPRKFYLKAANLGGLVNFECQSCKARIIKRHFKKHVDVECRPFVEKQKGGS
ncbi:hypothetical protein [Fundidesulfovibrio butyratiphilus]